MSSYPFIGIKLHPSGSAFSLTSNDISAKLTLVEKNIESDKEKIRNFASTSIPIGATSEQKEHLEDEGDDEEEASEGSSQVTEMANILDSSLPESVDES
jgi:hypothetical protein